MRTLVVENDAVCPLGELTSGLYAAGPVDVWQPIRGETSPSPGEYDAVVALGGGQSPADDAGNPWLARERALLGEAIAGGRAVLGLCLGAELLAQVLGASVRALPRPDVGWRRLQTTAAAAGDALFARLQGARVLQWHSYAFSLPQGATLLAGGDDRADAFRHGPRAWALQFHGEVNESIVADWISHYSRELPGMGVQTARLRRDTARYADAQARTAAVIADGFLRAGGR